MRLRFCQRLLVRSRAVPAAPGRGKGGATFPVSPSLGEPRSTAHPKVAILGYMQKVENATAIILFRLSYLCYAYDYYDAARLQSR